MSLALSALSAPALKARSGQFELEDIRHLRVHGLSIAQLGAGTLLACTSLVTLDISNNELRSLDGIEVLAALETLDVSANKLSNLSPVCKLVQLRVLDVSKNNVTEPKQLEHFRELKNLTNLRFGGHGNPVSLGDKHIPLLLEFAPTLQVIDDMPVELYKASRALLATSKTTLVPTCIEPIPLHIATTGKLPPLPPLVAPEMRAALDMAAAASAACLASMTAVCLDEKLSIAP